MGMFQNVEKNDWKCWEKWDIWGKSLEGGKIGMLWGGEITIEVILIEKPLSFKNVYHHKI